MKTWEEKVEEARRLGGKEFRQNGLPITCIRYDWAMLEHEHAAHPDYKFPVECKRLRPYDDGYDNEQEHALLYSNEDVAVTIYECCFAMWNLNDGFVVGGHLWEPKSMRLTEKSLDDIRNGRLS